MKRNSLSSVILHAVRRHIPLLILLILAVAGSVLAALLPPLVLERTVNILTAGEGFRFELALTYFALTALSGVMDSAKEGLITVFGQKVTHHLRTAMSRKLNRLSAGYYIRNESGAITSRFVSDVDTIDTLFTSGVVSMFADICKVVSVLLVIWFKSRGLGILTLLCLPLIALFTRFSQKRMLKAQKENRRAVGDANRQIPETIASRRTIRTLRRERYMENRYGSAIEASFAAQEKSNFMDAMYSPTIISINAVIVAVVMVLSVRSGHMQELFGMSAGTAVAVIAYVAKIFTPIEAIGMEIQNIQSAAAGAHRITDFLREEEMPPRENTAPQSRMPAVVIENVSFAYTQDTPILKGLSLTIADGERATLFGRTGAGKSTLFKLILGLYKPQEGSIRVFGADPADIDPAKRRRLFGYVEQSFHMAPGTVLEQVTLNDPDISREDAMKALRLAGLEKRVSHLKDGMDTPCVDGIFSQGELQLLSIARAVAADPSILLLDEITANLDSSTEQQILSALTEASRNRTVISISHRLYEKNGGRMIGIGTDRPE